MITQHEVEQLFAEMERADAEMQASARKKDAAHEFLRQKQTEYRKASGAYHVAVEKLRKQTTSQGVAE